MKLLIKELKGYSYRILDVETSKTFRAMKKDFDFCLCWNWYFFTDKPRTATEYLNQQLE